MTYHHLRHKTTTGHLVHGSIGHHVIDCGPVPQVCPEGLDGQYGVLAPELFAGCPECAVTEQTGRQWDGTFVKSDPTACRWDAQNRDGYGVAKGETLLAGTSELIETSLFLDTSQSPPRWRLEVHCATEGGIYILWIGEKHSGQTPLGSYQQYTGWLQADMFKVL